MDKTDRLRDYGLAFLLYKQGLSVCGYELIRELFIFIKLILNSYLLDVVYNEVSKNSKTRDLIDNYLRYFSKLRKETFSPKGESMKEYFSLQRRL